MTNAPTKARAARWQAITNLQQSDLHQRAADAHQGYSSGLYSSGYEAGLHHEQALPEGTRSDQRVRAWGDYLIDLGEHLAAA